MCLLFSNIYRDGLQKNKTKVIEMLPFDQKYKYIYLQ